MLDPLRCLDPRLLRPPLHPSYAAAITVAVYLATSRLTARSARSMRPMAKLGPELRAIRQGDNRQRAADERTLLLRRAGASPIGRHIPALVQMPVFLVIYELIRSLTNEGRNGLDDQKYLAADSVLRAALEADSGHMASSMGTDLAVSATTAIAEGLLAAAPFLGLIGATVSGAPR